MDKQTNTPKDWVLLAERDLSVADYLAGNMRPVPAEIIAFLCQQATEKYLKGALVILGEEPPYIHDLDDLCTLAEKHKPSFAGIASLCTIITQFSVQPRYDIGLRGPLKTSVFRGLLTPWRKPPSVNSLCYKELWFSPWHL